MANNNAPHTNGRLRAPKGGLRHNGKTYRPGALLPAHYQKESARPRDPAAGIDAAPPNFGRFSLPHVITFQGLMSTISKVYRNPDEAIKNSRENSLKMRRDCFVMECLEARQRGTALLNWHLEPEDKDSEDQKELCDQLTKILQDIPRFTEYRRNLLEALWFGRYAVQHQYGFDRRYGFKRTLIKGWLPVHGDKLAFRYDDGTGEYDENQIGIRVIGHYSIGDKIAGDRKLEPTDFGLAYFLQPWERTMFAVHKHMIEDAAFEDITTAGSIHGVGIRSRIYWTWYQMQEALGMLVEYIERTGMGFTIYWYPAGNDAGEKKMRQVAFERSESNVILMPRTPGDEAMDGYGIDRIEPNPQGAESLKSIVHEFFGHRIKRYILGQTLTTESQPLGLGGGAADVQYDSLLAIVEYDAANLEETITKEVVEPLKQWNFPASRDICVRFKIDTESHESEKKLQAFKSAWDMGTKIKAADVYNVIGASQPTEEDEVLINPSIIQQTRLWEQQHGGQAMGNQAMGADLPQDAIPGSIEDLFGPLANLSEGDEPQGPAGGGDSQRAQYRRGRELLDTLAKSHPRNALWLQQQRIEYRREGDAKPSTALATNPAPTSPASALEKKHQVGETKVINGESYRLNENHRWERTGDDPDAGGDQPQPQQPPQAGPPGQPQAAAAGPSTEQRQQFAAKQLGSIDKSVAGMFKAFHASPEYQQGGEYWTQHFAPQQAEAVHKQLVANVGKDFGGGKVVDLGHNGEGWIGFSSPAGAMVVAPPKEPGGKWRVSYTVMTGPVKRAMEGGEALPSEQGAGQPNGQPQEQQPPQEQVAQAVDEGQPAGQSDSEIPSVEGVEPEVPPTPQAPPQIPSEWLQKQHDAIADQAREHQANIASLSRRKDELLATGDPTDKKMAGEIGRKLVAERAKLRLKQADLKEAKQHLMTATDAEQSAAKQASQAKSKRPTGKESAGESSKSSSGKFHEMTRDEFSQAGHGRPEHHKQHLKEALGRGERVPIHVLKDYPELILAAARQADRKSQEPQQPAEQGNAADTAKPEIAEPFRSLNDADLQAALASVGAIKAGRKQLSRDELNKIAATLAPANSPAAGPTQAEPPKPKPAPTPQSPEQQAKKRVAELLGTGTLSVTTKLSAGRAAPSMQNIGLLQKAVASGAIPDKETLSKVLDESRRLAEAGDKDNLESALKSVTVPLTETAAGTTEATAPEATPAAPAEPQPKEPGYSATERYNIQSVLGESGGEKVLADAGLQTHGRNQAALRRAVAGGEIADSKQLAGVLKTAAKLKGRGDLKADDHSHVKEAIRRHVNRQANKVDLGAIVEERAAEAQVSPADLHEAIKHVHGFRSEAVKARENAKAELRKRIGLNAHRINQLENSGKDYADVVGFDELTESAMNDPELAHLGVKNSQDVWRLLKEGATRAPARHDDVIIEEALAFLKLNKSQEMSDAEREELDKIPFRKWHGLWLKYEKLADDSVKTTFDEFIADDEGRSSRSDLLQRVESAALETDTDPSPEQRKAGNYRKGKVLLHGLKIAIETPAGAMRSGVDRDGNAWSIEMPHHYGYICRTESEADGDHVDVFVGPNPESEIVFVVDQLGQGGGKFDEHKCMLGWTTAAEAKEAYLSAYSDGWKGFGCITPMTIEQFKCWLVEGDTGEPVEQQVSKYARYKPGEGQQELFDAADVSATKHGHASDDRRNWTAEDERKHPRANDGKFRGKRKLKEEPSAGKVEKLNGKWEGRTVDELAVAPLFHLNPLWFDGAKSPKVNGQFFKVLQNDDGTFEAWKEFEGNPHLKTHVSSGKDAEATMNNIWRGGGSWGPDSQELKAIIEKGKAGEVALANRERDS